METKPYILVVDDEAAERVTLGEVLRLEGYHVSLAATGEDALKLAQTNGPFDVAILDLRLPGIDGLQVLDGLRRNSAETVIILITGYGSMETAILALRKGAYDFLLKPCPVEDVLGAVRKALGELKADRHRRSLVNQLQQTLQEMLQSDQIVEPEKRVIAETNFVAVGDVEIDQAKHVVKYRGKPVDLTPTEFKLLECLMDQVDKVCTPQDLVRCAQGYETDAWGARSIVRVHIRRLRRKLEPNPDNPRYILNVRGIGYVFSSTGE